MLTDFFAQFLAGTGITIALALCALAMGLCLGVLGAAGKVTHLPALRLLANSITSLIRGLPELLVIFFIYFGGTWLLAKIFDQPIEVNAFISGVVALGLIFGAYASETLRGAYLAIPQGQQEAAKSFGFTPLQTFFRILLPQIWSHAMPGLCNLWFVLLKDTALVSLIGLTDLMRVAQNATAYTNQPFTFYFAAALIYLLLTSVSLLVAKRIEKRINRHRLHYY